MNQFTSGDILADRRADYARMLAENGESEGAAELMTQALEIKPGWAAGWLRLAEYEQTSGRTAAAVTAFEQVLRLDPGDPFGAGLKLAFLGVVATPGQPPSRYVEQLFDDYAGRFDTALIEQLDYRVPEKLAKLAQSHAGAGHRFSRVVDLGCGTGLFGEHIRAQTDSLEGFDLSLNMLAKARDKGLYDHLQRADLSLASEISGLFSADHLAERADLVAAADVMIYLGALDTVFSIAAELLCADGLFAFSVEDSGADAGYRLNESLRYAHSESYIRHLCTTHGFEIGEPWKTGLRKDGGKHIVGILFVAQKRA